MNCSVNLVPEARLLARARARRRTAWLTACGAAGVLLAAGWGVLYTAGGALTRLEQRVSDLEGQRSQVQRRLVAAAAQRTELLGRLRTAAATRRPQVWARRLMALTQAAPEGVFLTSIDIVTLGAGSTGQGSGRNSAGAERPPSRLIVAGDGMQSVRLKGYALDHAALIQLYNAVQNLPGWRQLELVRATSEPFRGGSAVAFELAGLTEEDSL